MPQAPDLLEKLAESLLYNLNSEQILLKLKVKKLSQKICSINKLGMEILKKKKKKYFE